MSKIILQACIDSDEIIRSLMELSMEELVEFLMELDEAVGDWDFTSMARDYFVAEMEKVD